MDLDILHIRLTAYALGELEPAQKIEVERILTESQDARDQVAHTKNIAKAVRDLLPQTADDVQPMTPSEYRAHKGGHWAPPPGVPTLIHITESGLSDLAPPTEISSPIAPPVAAPAALVGATPRQASAHGLGNGLIWLLAICCALLAIGWFLNTSSAPPASKETLIPASDVEVLKNNLTEARASANAAKQALEKELAARTEVEQKNALIQKSNEALQNTLTAAETEKKELEEAQFQLEQALARAQSAASAFHQPFIPTGSQVVFSLPASASVNTLEYVGNTLKDGEWPLASKVDVSELVQSLSYRYPAPPPNSRLPILSAISTACPWAPSHVLVRITLVAGTQAASLSTLQIEFNPSTVAHWRLIGRETRLENGRPAGGQGCGEIKPGTALTLLCELEPAVDPVAPLQAQRVELTQKMADAKRAAEAAIEQDAQAEAKLAYESLRLDLQDLDALIAKTQFVKSPEWRYSKPATPTAEAASGAWLAVSASIADTTGKTAVLQTALAGKTTPFPEADADFRLAAGAAALGLTLRDSPARGKADLALVSAILKDLPQENSDVKTLTDLAQKASALQEAQ